MATNPMQRKARNSFLLGMLVMLLISGVIIALLFMQLMNKSKKEQEEKQASVNVYVLNKDVESGNIITTDMLVRKTVNKNLVPSNATSDISVIQNYALQDKEGNPVTSKTKTVNNATVQALYITIDNKEYELKEEEETENYYIEKNNTKEYIKLNTVPLIAKVNMKKNTVITKDLVSKGDNTVQDDIRKQEYNMIILPMDLETGDYVDIRLMLPSGQDYIVVSKKEVEVPNIGGTDSIDTIWVNLSEEEILQMSCAIIDASKVEGAKLYANKYTEPGLQEAATPTYIMDATTYKLLQNDPNIVAKARSQLISRYNKVNNSVDGTTRRDEINNQINAQGQQAQTNLENNMQDSITNSKSSRKEYLNSLQSTY